jgi:EmrB/QacA subfamily drug resistance transporter
MSGASPPRAADAHRWQALTVTSLGALLASLNMSTLVIALPSLLRSLHTGLLEVVWVLLSYLLAQTAVVLSAGRLGDIYGRKRLYAGGFALFTVMALASGFAGMPLLLIALRVFAGIGGALMLASISAIVADAFPRRELGLALGINAMVIAVGSAIGPVLGGWLTSFGWQWVFWFNVPLGVLGSIASLVVLREVRGAPRTQRIDWRGNLVFLVALTGLLVALSMGGIEGWTHPAVITGAVLFVLATPLFFWLQNIVSDPLLDFTLFRNRLFAVANLTQFLNGLARMGLLFLLVFYFQGPEGKDPVLAGVLVALLVLGLISLLSAPLSMLRGSEGSRRLEVFPSVA